MESFVYTGLPSRVEFGAGMLDTIADEVLRLNCQRALVLSTPQQAADAASLAARLGKLSAGTFTQAAMHTPGAITEQAVAVARARQADCTVALGGGSTTGLGKAIALRTDLAQIVIPTIIVHRPLDRDARSDALYGAWACGVCLGSVGMALHHKLCHVLGGSFDLPHAETHTVILPPVAFNESAAIKSMRKVADILGSANAAEGLFDFAQQLHAPFSLKEIGMPVEGLDCAADLAVASPYPNPRPIARASIRALLDDAFHGRRPRLTKDRSLESADA